MNNSKPNILFIMTDQEAVSLSGCYGNDRIKTPARDSIAENGIRFENHYVASFPCTPSRATMITGLYAHNHGLINNGIVLDENIETLGSQLAKGGYSTTWIGKSHLGGWFEPHDEETCPYHELFTTEGGYELKKHPGGAGGEDYQLNGFDTWVSGWTDYRNYLQTTDLPDDIKKDRWVGGHVVMESGPDSEHAYSRLTANHHMATWMSTEAVQKIADCDASDQPFCMVLSYYAPHHPVAPPKPYDTLYNPADMVLPESYQASPDLKNIPLAKTDDHDYGNYIAQVWSEDQARDYLARYYGYVSYLDDQIQRVLDALKENGLYDNTIVIFSSDHGDMLCEQGMIYKHTFNGYDTLMKVPLTIQWPAKIAVGHVHNGLSSHIDLMPTILELAGVEQTTKTDGRSMAGVLTGTTATARDKIFIDVMTQGWVVREGQWKFVLNVAFAEGELIRKIDELFDLENDPNEVNNLVFNPEHAHRIGDMKHHIFTWLETTGHPYVDAVRQAAELPMTP